MIVMFTKKDFNELKGCNKGFRYEDFLRKHLNYKDIAGTNDNTAATITGDLEKAGKTYQVKTHKATISSAGVELKRNDIVKETLYLIREHDAADEIILGGFAGYWNNEIVTFNYTKDGFCELIKDHPEILWYDTDSRTGKTSIRIKVNKTRKPIYQGYAYQTTTTLIKE